MALARPGSPVVTRRNSPTGLPRQRRSGGASAASYDGASAASYGGMLSAGTRGREATRVQRSLPAATRCSSSAELLQQEPRGGAGALGHRG